MTLIMSGGLGGRFSIMTADTRQVGVFAGMEFKAPDEPNKVESLTGWAMIGAGGDSHRAMLIKRKLSEIVDHDYDLHDCLEPLRTVIRDLSDDLRGKSVQVIVSGFMRNGSNGEINYITREEDTCPSTEVTLRTFETGRVDGSMITLSDDHIEEIMSSISAPADFSNPVQALVNHYANIHATLAYKEPDGVSPIFKYYVIRPNVETGVLEAINGEIDTSEWFGLMEEVSRTNNGA